MSLFKLKESSAGKENFLHCVGKEQFFAELFLYIAMAIATAVQIYVHLCGYG